MAVDQSKASIQTWLQSQLQRALGFERPEDAKDIATFALSLSTKQDIEDNLYGFLGDGADAKQIVVDLLKKLGKWEEPAPVVERKPLTLSQEGLTVYVKDKDDDLDMYRVKGKQSAKGKKKEDKYELALPEQNKPYRVEQTVFVYKKKKKAKGGANDGEHTVSASRSKCGCQARLHILVNNCTRCGRIVCSKEGAGPCFHCGANVYAVSGEAAENVAAVIAAESGASEKELAGLARAQEHLGKLLEYDQNAVRRTTVYDDQADYFDMSKWLSEDERKVLKEKEEAILREKEARKNMITIDFAGRKVVTEEAEAVKFEQEILQQIAAGAHMTQKKASESLMFNPSAVANAGMRPQFIAGAAEEAAAAATASATTSTKKKRRLVDDDDEDETGASKDKDTAKSNTPAALGRNYARAVAPVDASKINKSSRIQHEFYPETNVDITTLDFAQMVAEDKTSLENASKPLERRGVIVSRSFADIQSAKSMIQWLGSKKANSMIYLLPAPNPDSASTDKKTQSVPLKMLNAECSSVGIKLCAGIALTEFDFSSEESVAILRSYINDLTQTEGIQEIGFFFGGGDINAPAGFRSLAQAQAGLVNSTIKFFEKADSAEASSLSWLVAPTRAHAKLEMTDAETTQTLTYARELDSLLRRDVTLLWNGVHKITRKISLEYLKKLKGCLRHKTVLWERAPLKVGRPEGNYFIGAYTGRASELGCFTEGVVLSIQADGDDSWKPYVGSALSYAIAPTTYSPEKSYAAEISRQFDGKSDLVNAAQELADAMPSSLFRSNMPPSCLRSGTKDEVTYFARQVLLAQKLASSPWSRSAAYAIAFAKANELYASFETQKRIIDHGPRVKLTEALRTWSRLLVPASVSITSRKKSLFKHQIPDKMFVQEIQSHFFKWEQQAALVKSQRSSRVPRAASAINQTDVKAEAARKMKELEDIIHDDLIDLESFMIEAYNDADLEALRDYLNLLHYDSSAKQAHYPPITTPPTKQFNKAALDRFATRVNARRAEAAARLAAAQAAAAAEAPPEPQIVEKCQEVKKLPVPGLRYFKNFITREEEETLLRDLDSYVWSSTLHRRTQQYGYIYDYGAVKSQEVGESRLSIGPMMPPPLQRLADRLYRDNICPARPDQCIVNEYLPGQGINPHIDHAASFNDCIVSISLGSDVIMDFKNLKGGEEKPVFLQRRSAVVLAGDARYHWQHGIAARETDTFQGKETKRGKRISITFRKISPQAVQAITKVQKR